MTGAENSVVTMCQKSQSKDDEVGCVVLQTDSRMPIIMSGPTKKVGCEPAKIGGASVKLVKMS